MRSTILIKSLLPVLFALFTFVSLQAQSNGRPAKQPKNDVAKELNLSPEQEAAFKKADASFEKQSKDSRNAKKEEMQRLRDEHRKAHRAVLTEAQAQKYDAMVAKRDAKREQKTTNKAEKKSQKKGQKAERKAHRHGNTPHDEANDDEFKAPGNSKTTTPATKKQ